MNFCSNCGVEVKAGQAVCLSCGFALKSSMSSADGEVSTWWSTLNNSQKRRGPAFLWGWFLGGFGAHRLYLGSKWGVLMLILGLLGFITMGATLIVTGVWTIIDLIRMGTASREEFLSLFMGEVSDGEMTMVKVEAS